MKRRSIRQLYYFTMMCHIFTLICGIAGSIIMFIYSNDFINIIGEILGIIFTISIISLFLILVACSINVIITLLKDLKSIKRNDFISIIGKVIKFKRNRDPDSGVQIDDKPVVINLDTNEEIVLNINDRLKIGNTYKFNYLKNSKIAEITKQLEID